MTYRTQQLEASPEAVSRSQTRKCCLWGITAIQIQKSGKRARKITLAMTCPRQKFSFPQYLKTRHPTDPRESDLDCNSYWALLFSLSLRHKLFLAARYGSLGSRGPRMSHSHPVDLSVGRCSNALWRLCFLFIKFHSVADFSHLSGLRGLSQMCKLPCTFSFTKGRWGEQERMEGAEPGGPVTAAVALSGQGMCHHELRAGGAMGLFAGL